MIPLPRTVKPTVPPMVGLDIEAHARAMFRELDMGAELAEFVTKSDVVRRTWGGGKVELAKKCARKAKLPDFGWMGPNLYEWLWKRGAYDAKAQSQLLQYSKPKLPSLVYPHDKDWHSYCGGYVHETGGIPYNMALDFMASPGTPVLAPEGFTITRTSGYNPNSGIHGSHHDVFGWSIYARTLTGFYFATHFGQLLVSAGDKVKVGEVIGYVGNWPDDPPRSHTHLGFTSFSHLRAMGTRKIRAVEVAPRIHHR